ncbi:AraC family transcriptional regulator [Streptococcus sp. DD12]|uniref:AraC family transcriptional regulator n=1 Tax=Streptococcus sp. DD12 TaxID=1777880 RepID=UPI000792CFF7|nr:AraC family transcriptional regulator [Streptococcus sp. DD12]KXT75739.1 Transcriptional regulator, AraC family [Streptococcus sp. DD12]
MKDFLTDAQFKHDIAFANRLLPYKLYQTQVKDGQPDILLHWHPEVEIQFIREGSARYHVNNAYFDSQPGDIILMSPHAIHSIHPHASTPHVTDTLQFHLDMLGYSHTDQTSLYYLTPLQQAQVTFLPRIQPQDPGYQAIKTCLFNIFDGIRKEDRHFELRLQGQLFELIYLLFYHRYVVKKDNDDMYRKSEKIRDIIDIIHQHYQDKLTIDQLAQQMGYSKAHFMTVFKQFTGVSCIEFIIQVRLQKSTELLSNTLLSVLEIANQVGFTNLSNFNRQFKRYYHLSPSAYRNLQKAKKD